MSGFLNYDNKFMTGIDKIVDVFYISILWVFACIPIFTIGAATTAMYYTINKVLRHGRGYVWKEFWGAFRSNFKQSTIIWLIMMLLYALMAFDTYVMYKFAESGASYGKIYIFFVVVMIFVTMWALYVFPFVARFSNTTKAVMKNAALIAIANLPKTLLIFLIFVAAAFGVYMIGFLVVVIPAVAMWIMSYLLEGIFRKYMTPQERAAEDERNGEYHQDGK